MKNYGKVEAQFKEFLTSALHAGEWSTSLTVCFTPEERAPVSVG
jgi:hypothetical protein